MTWGNDKKVDATDIVGANDIRSVGPDPGKQPKLKGPSYTGNAYDDHGTTCDQDPKHAGCTFPPDVRKRVTDSVIREITEVGNIFQRACDMIRVEKLLQADAPMPAVIAMALDVLTMHLGSVITESLLAVREHAIGYANRLEIQPTVIGQISADALKALVGTGMIKGKALAASLQPTSSVQKSTAIAFLKELKRSASVAIEQLWKTLPAYCTDVELAGYEEVFSMKYHEQATYEDLIRDKVDRYVATIPQIGRAAVPAGLENHPQAWPDGKNPHFMDVRVSWAKFLSGYPRRLMFEHAPTFVSDHSHDDDVYHKPVHDRMRPGLPPTSTNDPNADESHYHFVDPDLVEIAYVRHKLAWGVEPGETLVDDSSWYWDPPRMIAAQNKKNSPTPKLQLGSGPKTPVNANVEPATKNDRDDDSAQQRPYEGRL